MSCRSRAVVLAMTSVLVIGTQQAIAQKKPGPEDMTGLGKAMAPKALDNQRGGQAVVVNKNDLSGNLYDNRAIDNVTGNNYISDSAFSHSSGLPVAVQNSGNNVLIQNSFILN